VELAAATTNGSY